MSKIDKLNSTMDSSFQQNDSLLESTEKFNISKRNLDVRIISAENTGLF